MPTPEKNIRLKKAKISGFDQQNLRNLLKLSDKDIDHIQDVHHIDENLRYANAIKIHVYEEDRIRFLPVEFEVIPSLKTFKLSNKQICQYSTYLSTNADLANNLTLFGGLLSDVYELKKATTLTIMKDTENDSNSCLLIWENKIKNEVNEIYKKIGLSMYFNIPRKPCKIITLNGSDTTCESWTQKYFPHLKKQYIGECAINESLSDDYGFCSLKGRINQPCPLFPLNTGSKLERPSDKTISLEFQTESFYCSQNQNLQCQAESINQGKCITK